MKNFLYRLVTDKNKGPFLIPLKFLLLLLSFVYGAIIRLLIIFSKFRLATPSCRVISVGNITLGGTGKTSLVSLIARLLKDRKYKVAVISRGYKKLGLEMGDEPSMLLRGLGDVPVIVDKNRLRGTQRAHDEYYADTVIFDDGMQQWRVKKCLEIVVVNAVEGFGNRHMLPRGILREPLSSLKRADLFVLTKVDFATDLEGLKVTLRKFNPCAEVVESIQEPVDLYDLKNPEKTFPVSFLKGKKVALFSGIGDPSSFAGLIKRLGAHPDLDLRFIDHHNYSDDDLVEIISKSEGKGLNIIITTEKDAVRLTEERLKAFGAFQLLALRIQLKVIKNEREFFARLFSLRSI